MNSVKSSKIEQCGYESELNQWSYWIEGLRHQLRHIKYIKWCLKTQIRLRRQWPMDQWMLQYLQLSDFTFPTPEKSYGSLAKGPPWKHIGFSPWESDPSWAAHYPLPWTASPHGAPIKVMIFHNGWPSDPCWPLQKSTAICASILVGWWIVIQISICWAPHSTGFVAKFFSHPFHLQGLKTIFVMAKPLRNSSQFWENHSHVPHSIPIVSSKFWGAHPQFETIKTYKNHELVGFPYLVYPMYTSSILIGLSSSDAPRCASSYAGGHRSPSSRASRGRWRAALRSWCHLMMH